MALTGLGTFHSTSSYYTAFSYNSGSKRNSENEFFNTMLSEDEDEAFNKKSGVIGVVAGNSDMGKVYDAQCIPVMNKRYGESAAYSRIITANVKTKEMYSQANADGEVIFSYRETEQAFSVIINSNGKDKTYLIRGIDENGEEFERDFDPYSVDPEDMDYPAFSALCMYIRQTDETADLIASSYFTDTSYFDGIFDRGDRIDLLDEYAQEYRDTMPALAGLAADLFDSINTFLEEIVKSSFFDGDASSLLFEDINSEKVRERLNASGNVYDRFENAKYDIPDTIISNHSEYTDPETGEKVPVDITHTTSYSKDGIVCRKQIKDGDSITERELWKIDVAGEDDLAKIKDLLKSFGEGDRLTFASNEAFWRDYLDGSISADEFRDYYDSTNNGVIDFENRMREGEALRDIINEPYAEYFNNQSFIGHVWTEQEMWDDWNAKIEASQKAAKANGVDIEPPTETIITTNGKSDVEKPVWNWYDGRFGYYADVFKNEGGESEYTVRLRYIDGREVSRIVDVDKIDASNCNIVDLQVKMAHLRDEGKISHEDYMMDMVVAHFNMEHWMPKADENAMVDFRNLFERQHELVMRNDRNDKHIARMLNLLRYL